MGPVQAHSAGREIKTRHLQRPSVSCKRQVGLPGATQSPSKEMAGGGCRVNTFICVRTAVLCSHHKGGHKKCKNRAGSVWFSFLTFSFAGTAFTCHLGCLMEGLLIMDTWVNCPCSPLCYLLSEKGLLHSGARTVRFHICVCLLFCLELNRSLLTE